MTDTPIPAAGDAELIERLRERTTRHGEGWQTADERLMREAADRLAAANARALTLEKLHASAAEDRAALRRDLEAAEASRRALFAAQRKYDPTMQSFDLPYEQAAYEWIDEETGAGTNDEKMADTWRTAGRPMRRATKTWGDIYYKYRNKGHDHSDAAYRADEWERKEMRECPMCGIISYSAAAALSATPPASPPEAGTVYAFMWSLFNSDGHLVERRLTFTKDDPFAFKSNGFVSIAVPLTAADRLAAANDWNRKRAEDIIALGKLVHDENAVEWKARAEAAEARLAEAEGERDHARYSFNSAKDELYDAEARIATLTEALRKYGCDCCVNGERGVAAALQTEGKADA